MLPNNAFERTVGHRGPRLAAARSSWPAARSLAIMYRAVAAALIVVSVSASAKCSYANYTVRGMVTDNTGVAVSGANVVVTWRDALETQSQRFVSAADGTFVAEIIFERFSRRTFFGGDLCESRLSSATVQVAAPGFKSSEAVVSFTGEVARANYKLERQ